MKLEKIAMLGASVGLTSLALGRLWEKVFEGVAVQFSVLPAIDINVRQRIAEGVNTDVISKLLAILSGGRIELLPAIIISIIAGITVVFLGSFAVDFISKNLKMLPTGKKPIGKMVALLFYGSILGGLIVGLLSSTLNLPSVGVALSMIMYYAIVGLVYGFIASNIKALPKVE